MILFQKNHSPCLSTYLNVRGKKKQILIIFIKYLPRIQIKHDSYYDFLQTVFILEADCQTFPPGAPQRYAYVVNIHTLPGLFTILNSILIRVSILQLLAMCNRKKKAGFLFYFLKLSYLRFSLRSLWRISSWHVTLWSLVDVVDELCFSFYGRSEIDSNASYLLNYLLTYLLTYLLHGAESFLRSKLVCS